MARGSPFAAGLCVLALLAAVLRFASIGFDLDLHDPQWTLLSNHADARGMVRDTRVALERGSLDPNSFLYRGPAGFLVFGAVDGAAVALLAREHRDGRAGVLRELARNPAWIALLHRCASAAAGVLTVVALALLVRRELGVHAALGAGAVLAVSYLHVRDSQLGTVETLWGLALVLVLDGCSRIVRTGGRGAYARAGLFTGCAVAVKYFNVTLGLHLLLAHAFARRRARAEGRPAPPHARLVLALALVPAGFLLLFPGIFEAWDNLVAHVTRAHRGLQPAWDGVTQLRLLRFHVQETLGVGLGVPVLLAGVVGLFLGWRRGRPGRLMVLSVLGMVPALFLTNSLLVRYGFGLLVALAIPAGLALGELVRRRPLLGAAVAAAALAPSLARSVALARVWRAPDTRLAVLAELRERCARGERVVAFGLHHDEPQPLSEQPFRLVNVHHATRTGKLDLARVLAAPPPWILEGLEPQFPVDPTERAALAELLRTRYRPVLRLGRRDAPDLDFSAHTVPRALMVPWRRPWAVDRPGPALVVHERLDRDNATPAR